ncbi:MAG TPA: hypothetical protein VKG24_12515 [Pseudolabrys sp.]|jgi:hypothetical protein|nr:hypothetical protein [Pseudolabrys sp.]
MASKFVSRESIHVALAVLMIVSLSLAMLAFPVALIWIKQPIGNTAGAITDTLAWVFSVAFFTAFILAMVEPRPRDR